MKLTDYIKSVTTDEIPMRIKQMIGDKLSGKHLQKFGERPIKTPEYIPEKEREINTCEYPEWFLQQTFDSTLDEILLEIQNKSL